jgi:hypothetical protein
MSDVMGEASGLAGAETGDGPTLHAVYTFEDDQREAYFEVYARSRDAGRKWTDWREFRAWRSRIAAAGEAVYLATWADDDDCRGIGLWRNTRDGSSRSWRGPTCLRDRGVDSQDDLQMSIAATGRLVYVTAFDGDEIALWISRDRGKTFDRTVLGSVRCTDPADCDPDPVVAADGDIAVAAWGERGAAVARASSDAGRSWSDAQRLAPGTPRSASARDERLAVTGGVWIEDEGPVSWVSILDDHVWRWLAQPRVATAAADDIGPPTVALGPDGRMALLYCGTRNVGQDGHHEGLLWIPSADGGSTWTTPEWLVGFCPDEPQVAWPDADLVAVLLWDGETEGPAVYVRR